MLVQRTEIIMGSNGEGSGKEQASDYQCWPILQVLMAWAYSEHPILRLGCAVEHASSLGIPVISGRFPCRRVSTNSARMKESWCDSNHETVHLDT